MEARMRPDSERAATPPPVIDRLHDIGRNSDRRRRREEGRAGWILLWLLGVPIPVLLVLFLLRGCT